MGKLSCAAACLLSAVAALAFAQPAFAQDVREGWQGSVTPYLWLPAYDADVVDKATGDTIDSSADFGDILDNLSGVFLGKAEVQYNRTGLYLDVLYMQISTGQRVDGPLLGPITRSAEFDMTSATLSGFYRVAQSDRLNVDLLGGVRYVDLDLDLNFQGAAAGLSAEGAKSISEPIVGIRATQRIGPKSSITGYGDYGGFGGESTVWQLYATYNYQWRPKVIASFGYRHFVIDTETPRSNADVTLSGPLAGLTFRF